MHLISLSVEFSNIDRVCRALSGQVTVDFPAAAEQLQCVFVCYDGTCIMGSAEGTTLDQCIMSKFFW